MACFSGKSSCMPEIGEVFSFFILSIITQVWYNRYIGSVAQLVEQRPEEPCVTGSSPVGTTTLR